MDRIVAGRDGLEPGRAASQRWARSLARSAARGLRSAPDARPARSRSVARATVVLAPRRAPSHTARMTPKSSEEPEPRVEAALVPFVDGDFDVLAPSLARDPQYNDRRLVVRRKLLALAKVFVARAADSGVALDPRTSLHNPHAFNQNQVKRLWAYACRTKKEKSRLKQTLGADLAKDLDSAYRNAYLCVALEHDVLEVSLRIHADAWYDGQNFKNRAKKEGVAAWMALLNALPGFRLRLHDWKGEWYCGKLTREQLDEYLKFYVPAEHACVIEQRIPAIKGARAAVTDAGTPDRIVEALSALLPLYRWMAWSEESDFLFTR